MDYTGTGNTLNVRHPQVLKLIMDSLRYWVQEMHVDGFRFDLAAALARELHEVDRLSAFFDIIHQDPVLSQVKLIAEPWDVGEGGYQVGNFPPLWAEWNGTISRHRAPLLEGRRRPAAELGYRLTGSSDLYQRDGRQPYASINFVTAHDGFTLHDLVSYDQKHNEANGEDNRDGDQRQPLAGTTASRAPPTTRRSSRLRERQKRNFLATLLLSQGVPMICGGDEIGRTQHGNNNAYCQDNELSWFDWNLDEPQADAARLHAPPDRAAPRAPEPAPPQVLPGPQHRPRHAAAPGGRPRREGHHLAPSRRRRDDRRGVERRLGPLHRRPAERRHAGRREPASASRSATTRFLITLQPASRAHPVLYAATAGHRLGAAARLRSCRPAGHDPSSRPANPTS